MRFFVTSQDHHEISLVKNPAPHFCVLKCQIWLCGIRQYFTFSVYSLWKVSMHGNALTSQSISIVFSRFFRGPGHVDGPQISFPHCAVLALEYCITWNLRSACKQYKSSGRACYSFTIPLSLILYSNSFCLSPFHSFPVTQCSLAVANSRVEAEEGPGLA